MRLIHQTELNDCGPAVCCMILQHFHRDESLEAFKIQHHYQHEAYTFATMSSILQQHQIESESFAFENFQEVREAKALTCFQVINQQGMPHFVLGEPLPYRRWRIYDPGSRKAQILREKVLIHQTTGKLQFYYPERGSIHSKPKINWSFLWQVFKLEWFDCLCANFLIIGDLILSILISAFLRVVFVDFPILTLQRVGLLLLGLSSLIILNLSLTLVLNLINQQAATRIFQYFLGQQAFEFRVIKALHYLLPQDFERLFSQYQHNLLSLVTFLNQSGGFLTLTGITFYYFFQTSPLLMFSSLFLIFLLCTLNFYKRRWMTKHQQINQDHENYYFYELHHFVQRAEILQMKTSFQNYCQLKQLDCLYFKNSSTLTTLISSCERWLIYAYYLGLAYLINFSDSQLSLLFIYTSITFVFVGLLDNFGSLKANYQYHNYFQTLPIAKEQKNAFVLQNLSLNQKPVDGYIVSLENDELNKLKVNQQLLMNFEVEIYDARKAIDVEDSIYNNIFNYQKGSIEMMQTSGLVELIKEAQLDLSQKPQPNNLELINYLSCFFTSRKILILKKPKKVLADKLIAAFPKKLVIFVDEEN